MLACRSEQARRVSLRHASVYVAIVGFRYGSPVRDQPHRSYLVTTARNRGERSTASSFGRSRAAHAVCSAITAR